MLPNLISVKISSMAHAAALVLITALSSAQAQDSDENPSGSCSVRTDGRRAGYHDPLNHKWMPDCQNTLQREYWRVFVRGDVGYIMPRPDGAPELRPVWTDPRHELRSLVDRYSLCTAAASREVLQIVNSMRVSDALKLAHLIQPDWDLG
jgi:hypothetical protein